MLRAPNAVPGSFVVFARVRDIQGLCNSKGEPLNLKVIKDEKGDNPANALIVGNFTGAVSKALRDCFRRLDES